MSAVSLDNQVAFALDAVDDPEYPGVSIVDLGLLESVVIEPGPSGGGAKVRVGLIPTFSGCPALAMIADDVIASIQALEQVANCTVEWLPGPVWTTDRLTPVARQHLASDYTVVLRSKNGGLKCPVCGSDEVADQSMAGPTRCRSIAWCSQCRNPIEVMR